MTIIFEFPLRVGYQDLRVYRLGEPLNTAQQYSRTNSLWPIDTMHRGIFRCENPDFTVKSIPDGDIFNVRKECLITGSEVFRKCIVSLVLHTTTTHLHHPST